MDNRDHTYLLNDPRFMAAVKDLLTTPERRYVVRQLLAAAGIRQSTFTGNALSGAFAQGYQAFGLMLEDVTSRSAPELFLKMLEENYNEQVVNDSTQKS